MLIRSVSRQVLLLPDCGSNILRGIILGELLCLRLGLDLSFLLLWLILSLSIDLALESPLLLSGELQSGLWARA